MTKTEWKLKKRHMQLREKKINYEKIECTKSPEHSELKIKGKKIKIKIINERRWCRVAFYMKHGSYRNLYTRSKWEYFLLLLFEFLFVAFFCLYCCGWLRGILTHNHKYKRSLAIHMNSITHLTSLNFVSFRLKSLALTVYAYFQYIRWQARPTE